MVLTARRRHDSCLFVKKLYFVHMQCGENKRTNSHVDGYGLTLYIQHNIITLNLFQLFFRVAFGRKY